MAASSERPEAPAESPEARWFGFRPIPPQDKAVLVRAVFQSVASRYDLMNDLMSGGVHRLWKRQMVEWLNARPGSTILDVAGGTGDVALRILKRLKGRGRLVVVDASEAMLTIGRDRMIDQGLLAGIEWMAGDAEHLPIADAAVDAYTIAFGLRNVTHIDRALSEARRVLKPGGRFLCLEFSRVVVPVLDRLYEIYSFGILPVMGRVVVGDADSYRYLAESIRKFPPQDELAERIRAAGLEQVKIRNLTGGIAALHSAWRL